MKSKCCGAECGMIKSKTAETFFCMKCEYPCEITEEEPLIKLHPDYRQVDVEGFIVYLHKDEIYVATRGTYLIAFKEMPNSKICGRGYRMLFGVNHKKRDISIIWKIVEGKAVKI